MEASTRVAEERETNGVGAEEIRRFLVGDTFVRVTAALVGVLGLFYCVGQIGFQVPVPASMQTANAVLIGITLLATLGPSSSREFGLWRGMRLAYALWLSIVIFSLLPFEHTSGAAQVLTDCAYVTYYAVVLLALEYRDVSPMHWDSAQRRARVAAQASIIVLVVGLLAYFVLIPNLYGPSPVGIGMPSYLLYTIFDFVIGARFLHIASKSKLMRWRFFGVLSGIAFLSWGLIDLLDSIGTLVGSPIESGTVLDMLWFAPFLLVVSAHRLRLIPVINPRADRESGSGSLDQLQSFPAVGVLALVLVVVHIVGYGVGYFEEASRVPREVLIIVMVLVAMVSATSGRAISESASLTRRLSLGIEQGADSVIITDANGIIEYVNEAFVKTTGYTKEEAVGATPGILKSGHHDVFFFKELWETITAGKVYQRTITNRRKNGSIYFDERVISPLIDDRGRITHFVATGRDITGRVEDQRRLQFLATHDALTGLPNRSLLQERLKHAISVSKRHGRRLAVLFMDLDEFKNINDTMGHQRGDEVLKTVADRIASLTREGDTSGRVGGDEFIILMEEIADTEAVAQLAQRMVEAVRRPIWISDREISVTVSIGAAVYPEGGEDSQTLIGNADVAMYRAKGLGPGRVLFHCSGMTLVAEEK